MYLLGAARAGLQPWVSGSGIVAEESCGSLGLSAARINPAELLLAIRVRSSRSALPFGPSVCFRTACTDSKIRPRAELFEAELCGLQRPAISNIVWACCRRYNPAQASASAYHRMLRCKLTVLLRSNAGRLTLFSHSPHSQEHRHFTATLLIVRSTEVSALSLRQNTQCRGQFSVQI